MSEMYDSTRQTWEDIWDDASIAIELEAIDSPRAQETMHAYLPYLSKEGTLLEAGCGLGAVLIKLKSLGYTTIGLDYAENALHAIRAHDPALRLQTGDVHALPYRSNSLDGYLSFGVLEHFEHGVEPALREAFRILAPGGVLVLTIPYPNVVFRLVRLKRRLSGQSPLTDPEFFESAYTQHELSAAVEKVGFKVALVKPTSHSFTLWGLGGPFRAEGYYRSSALGHWLGGVLRRVLPWPFCFMTLIVARKP